MCIVIAHFYKQTLPNNNYLAFPLKLFIFNRGVLDVTLLKEAPLT